MNEDIHIQDEEAPRVLVASMREIATLVAYCNLYEFEDTILNLLEADVVKFDDYNQIDRYRKMYKTFKYLTKSESAAKGLIKSVINKSYLKPLERQYDLFFASFNNPYELFMLFSLDGWREKCKKTICYIVEFWEDDIPKCQHLIDLLKDFDHIFLGGKQSVKSIGEITGRPCTFLPFSVDTLKFCPYPLNPLRNIDICNLGRRSPVTHQELVKFSEERQFFYYYDTTTILKVINSEKQGTFHVKNAREHRLLLANLLKRSRYFIANRARANEPTITKGKDELSSRFFEGAAAGTIMLGDPPLTAEFNQCFDWPDAVISIPFDAPDIAAIIADLDTQADRIRCIRNNNVAYSLLRHDSVHRLEEIFKEVGIEPTNAMKRRKSYLKDIAASLAPQLATSTTGNGLLNQFASLNITST